MGKCPKIRFGGYTDDWEQRKVGDVIIEYKPDSVKLTIVLHPFLSAVMPAGT